jgi:hypothetical protein
MEGTRAFGLREGSYEISLDGSSLIDRNYGGVFNRQARPGFDPGIRGREQLFVGEVHSPERVSC